MRSPPGEAEPGASNEVGHDTGDQYFARLRMSHNAGRCMYGNATHVVASNFYLPGVKTRP